MEASRGSENYLRDFPDKYPNFAFFPISSITVKSALLPYTPFIRPEIPHRPWYCDLGSRAWQRAEEAKTIEEIFQRNIRRSEECRVGQECRSRRLAEH